MTRLLYRLGRACVQRRRRVVLVWIALAVGVIVLGQAAGGKTAGSFDVPGVEAQRALDTLKQQFPAVAGT
jgi:RND superfamily putative drug exporter